MTKRKRFKQWLMKCTMCNKWVVVNNIEWYWIRSLGLDMKSFICKDCQNMLAEKLGENKIKKILKLVKL